MTFEDFIKTFDQCDPEDLNTADMKQNHSWYMLGRLDAKMEQLTVEEDRMQRSKEKCC